MMTITEDREFHPVSQLFPLMEGAGYDELVEDIRKHGLREAIWLDETGRIIDGRNRYRACRDAGVEPRYRVWRGDGSLVAFVLGLNLHRRHLSVAQRAMVAARARPLFEDEARYRKLSGLMRGTAPPRAVDANLRARERERLSSRGKSSEHVARIVGVSPRSVDTAVRVLNSATQELTRLVDAGLLAVSAAGEVATLPVDEQKSLIERGPDAVRQRARELREERQHRIPLPSPRVVPSDLSIRPVAHAKVPHEEGEPGFLAALDALKPFFRGEHSGLLLEDLGRIASLDEARLSEAYDVVCTALHRLERVKLEMERRRPSVTER